MEEHAKKAGDAEAGKGAEKEQHEKHIEKNALKGQESRHECREEEYKAVAQMVQAEFENYKKRMEKRYEENARFSNAEMIRHLLPFLDSIDSALNHMEKSEKITKENAIEGMKNLRGQIMKILRDNGCEEINARGKFNPEMHECAISKNEQGKDDEVILNELRKGYTLHKKVLRPSMVEVNKVEPEEEKEKQEEKKEVGKNE